MRILLADHESNVRFALRTLLERQPGLQIVGAANRPEVLLDQVQANRPDLILFDWSFQESTTVDLLSTLHVACPDLTIVALSGRPEARQRALIAGADAFVGKTDSPDQLLSILRSIPATERRRGEEKHNV
jgi:DNA-binding NarL/FixJ family response regulator